MAKKGLKEKAYKVSVFHANMSSAHREAVLAAVKGGVVTVVFGTVCLGLVRCAQRGVILSESGCFVFQFLEINGHCLHFSLCFAIDHLHF